MQARERKSPSAEPRHPSTHEVDLVIELNTDLAPSMIGETFLHEVVEMVDKIYGLELPHPAIQTLAAGIYQALTTSVNEAK